METTNAKIKDMIYNAKDFIDNNIFKNCKSQYKNAQKVEYKNVQFPYLSSST